MQTTQSANVHQDAHISPLYKESDWSEAKYSPSIHFPAKKLYDTAIYRNDLMFAANILDEQFQRDVVFVSKEIASEMDAIYIADIIFLSGFERILKEGKRNQTSMKTSYMMVISDFLTNRMPLNPI